MSYVYAKWEITRCPVTMDCTLGKGCAIIKQLHTEQLSIKSHFIQFRPNELGR